MFYEIIYETGDHSVAMYKDDAEAIGAISEHHNRAKKGGPQNASHPDLGPATRIAKVLKYEVHPVDLYESQALDKEDVTAAVTEAIERLSVGGLVSIPELQSEVRMLTETTVNSEPHESNYKMEEVGKLEGWEDV